MVQKEAHITSRAIKPLLGMPATPTKASSNMFSWTAKCLKYNLQKSTHSVLFLCTCSTLRRIIEGHSPDMLILPPGNLLEWSMPKGVSLEGIEFRALISGAHTVTSDFMYVCVRVTWAWEVGWGCRVGNEGVWGWNQGPLGWNWSFVRMT